MNTKLMLTALAASLSIAAAAAAEEQTWKVGSSYVIRVHDLDLDVAADQARLLARVEHAGTQLCAKAGVRRSQEGCRAAASADAMAKASPKVRRAVALAAAARNDLRFAGR